MPVIGGEEASRFRVLRDQRNRGAGLPIGHRKGHHLSVSCLEAKHDVRACGSPSPLSLPVADVHALIHLDLASEHHGVNLSQHVIITPHYMEEFTFTHFTSLPSRSAPGLKGVRPYHGPPLLLKHKAKSPILRSAKGECSSMGAIISVPLA